MVSPSPLINIYHEIPNRLKEEYLRKYLSKEAQDREEHIARREYRRNGPRTLAQRLARTVVSGEWNMGDSQTEVGMALDHDHTCMSDALRKQEMSSAVLWAILLGEDRPDERWPTREVVDAMNRGGFIAGARHYAGLVNDRSTLVPDELNEFRYELLCDLWANYVRWQRAVMTENASFALEVIRRVCKERDVMPVYGDKEIARVQGEIDRLLASEDDAFRGLKSLWKNWEDIFAVTAFATASGVRYSYEPTARRRTQ